MNQYSSSTVSNLKNLLWIVCIVFAGFALTPASADLSAGDIKSDPKPSSEEVRALQSAFDQFYQAEADGNQEAAHRFRDQIRRQLNSLQAKNIHLKFDSKKLSDDQLSAKLLSLQSKAPGSSQVAGTAFLKKTINVCVVLANLTCGVMTGDYDHPDLEPVEPEIIYTKPVVH